MGGRDRAELILGHVDRLPTLPVFVTRLLAVTLSDESSARDVAQIIETDAALTAGILRMVRRADLGVSVDQMTVGRAISLLGFRAVRNAVLSAQVFDVFSGDEQRGDALADRNELWRHNLGVACVAEAIAEKLRSGSFPADAFVCGLLHDIGKIALDACLPKSYSRVMETVRTKHRCICDVEKELFGLDHTIAGKRLSSRWGLSRSIVERACLHHQGSSHLPSTVSAPELVKIVHLADAVVRANGVGFSGYLGMIHLADVAEELGLGRDDLALIADSLPKRMSPLLEVVGLDSSDGSVGEVHPGDDELVRQLRKINADLYAKNEALSARSVFLDALDHFVRNTGEGARLSDVCEAAAEAACDAFASKGAICWVLLRQSPNLCVAVSLKGSGRAVASLLDRTQVASLKFDDPDWIRGKTNGQCGQASKREHLLWHHAVGSPPQATLQAIALRRESVTGGVVFDAGEGDVVCRDVCKRDAATFACAVAMAAGDAWGRMSAEQMAEELVELNRELQSAQSDLLRMRSMSMISEMAAGAAHELNNPLAVISGRSQMERARADNPEQARAFETIIEQASRASEIVSELMRFAKPEKPTPIVQKVSDVFEAVREHWVSSDPQLGDRLGVELYEPGATVYADAGQVVEMLNHVVSNAVTAVSQNNGRVILRSLAGASDDTVRIIVRDEGCGMSPEVVDHATGPFFSHREAGRGRGLGLSRASRLAEINGGRWRIDSAPNAGTSVVIELPARQGGGPVA